MIETFLLCVIALNAMNCTTLHPDLDQLIPYDNLNHYLKPVPVLYNNNNNNNVLINKLITN
jgi:hypothetical protein